MGKRLLAMILAFVMIVAAVPFGDLTVSAATLVYYDIPGGELIFDKDTGTITGHTGDPTQVVFPDSIEGVPVTRIGSYVFLVSQFSQNKTLKSIVIPDSVTEIEGGAFEWCTALENIDFGKGIQTIGARAFQHCNVKELRFPESLMALEGYTYLWTDYGAFQNCENLETVVFENSPAVIGTGVLQGCSKLKTMDLGNSIKEIHARAISGSIDNIMIPASVTSIDGRAFVGLNAMAITVDADNQNYFSNNNAIYKRESNGEYVLLKYATRSPQTSYSIIEGTYYIEDSAFKGAEQLRSVEFPSSLQRIGGSGFSNCTALESVVLSPSTTRIDSSAFASCTNLESVFISGVTFIGMYAFRDCTSLSDITLPYTLKELGTLAFTNCTSLGSISIPNTKPYDNGGSVGGSWFADCKNLETVSFTSSFSQDSILPDTFSGCEKLTTITIPDSVTGIRDRAFMNCTSLEKLIIPVGVTWIVPTAFSGCTNLVLYVYEDTYAHDYALSQGIPFVLINVDERANFGIDRWAFSNQHTPIDYEFYTWLYGRVQGAWFHFRDSGNGTQGQCFGMAATTAAINDKSPDVATFGNNKKFLVTVGLDDSSPEIGMTAADFIKYGYILQFHEKFQRQKKDNANNLQKLYDAVKAFQTGNGEPVVIGIGGDIFGVTYRHAVYALGIANETALSCEIVINDSNDPNQERKIILIKESDGSFCGWSYQYFEGVIWGSGHSNEYISYTMPAESLYRVGLFNAEFMDAPLITDSLLLTVGVQAFAIQMGDLIEYITDDYSGSDWLIPIKVERGADDLSGVFWADSKKQVTISDLNEPTNIALAGYEGSIDVMVPAETIVSLIVSENGGEQAELDLPENSEFSIKYSTANGEYLDYITITGTSEDAVKTSYTKNGIAFTGAHDVTVYAEREGKSASKYFSNISDDGVKKVNVADIGNGIDIVVEDVATCHMNVINGRGSGDYVEGATVTIVANDAPRGQRFKEWEITPTVVFGGGTKAIDDIAKVDMPSQAVVATAIYEDIPPTDVQAVEENKTALTWDVIKGSNALQSNVTANLDILPTAGANGTTITWQSANSAITNTGVVTRPSSDASDATGVLTATITKGTATDMVVFDITVLKTPQSNTSPGGGGSGGASSKPKEDLTDEIEEETETPIVTAEWQNSFTDVNASDWFYNDVKYSVENGLFKGITETTFEPNLPMTRAMIITVLARYAGVDTEGGEMWYSKAIEWGVAKGITDGTNPNDNVTREQLAALLWRFAEQPERTGDLSGFADNVKISDWAVNALEWTNGEGLINGYPDGTVNPQGNATRAEVAAIIHRFVEAMK